MPRRRENAGAREESLVIRRKTGSLAEEFAKTARFALYGFLANGFIRDEERHASRS
jgi:hypothetical protein